MIGKQPDLQFLKGKEQKKREQTDKEKEEKKREQDEQEKKWKQNALLCLNENESARQCLNQKKKEDAVFFQLKSTMKTIHEDHEKHFKYLAELLSLNNLSELSTSLHLLFRASEHEWPLANKFHELCDGKGPTITIARSEHKKLFGGYSSISWNSNGWSSASGSFLFSLDNQIKLTIEKHENMALRGDKKYGPSFGDNDLVLSYSGGDLIDPNHPNWSDLGFTYSLPDGIFFQ